MGLIIRRILDLHSGQKGFNFHTFTYLKYNSYYPIFVEILQLLIIQDYN